MLYVMHPEITLVGQDQADIRRQALAVVAALRQLPVSRDVVFDLDDDQCLTQHDPDPDYPLSPALRARLEAALQAHYGLDRDLSQLTEEALLRNARWVADDDLLEELLPHLQHRHL